MLPEDLGSEEVAVTPYLPPPCNVLPRPIKKNKDGIYNSPFLNAEPEKEREALSPPKGALKPKLEPHIISSKVAVVVIVVLQEKLSSTKGS